MKTITAVAAIAVMSLTSVSALCQDEPKETETVAEKIIEKLDTDEDKKISKEEAKPNKNISDKFTEIDKDKDGVITLKELDDYMSNKNK